MSLLLSAIALGAIVPMANGVPPTSVSENISPMGKGASPRKLYIADKTRAEALMKAVETGQVDVVVMHRAQPALNVNSGEATSALAGRD